jgi:hypothetical protein
LADEFDGDRAAVLQRYAFAAAFSTGVMMPIGFEYGFRKALHVAQMTPEDWEAPTWDLTGTIGEIHRTKAALPPLNEEGLITPLALDADSCFAFWKRTRDGSQAALVVLNLDRTASARVRVPVGAPTSSRRVATDPTTGALRALPDSGELQLPAAGVLIVHEVEQDGRATGVRGAGLATTP